MTGDEMLKKQTKRRKIISEVTDYDSWIQQLDFRAFNIKSTLQPTSQYPSGYTFLSNNWNFITLVSNLGFRYTGVQKLHSTER